MRLSIGNMQVRKNSRCVMTINRTRLFWMILLVSALMVYQVRLLNVTGRYVGLQDIDVLKREADELQLNITQSKQGLELKRQELANLQNSATEDEVVVHLKSEIERFRMFSGLTDVSGEGVLIIINDGKRALFESETPSDLIVHDLDLRTIVDDLRIAGAEAISVNGTRIISGLTEIICNGPTIRINGVQQAQPYIIRAIGDRFKLEAKLKDPESYTHALSELGLEIEVNTRIQLSVERLVGRMSYKYAELLN
jgi:uncharacterized protein YlxW (UPF0749 family)